MSEPYYAEAGVTVYAGDCIEVMRSLPDASVHAVVTDPPYGLEFMGKDWDSSDGFRRSLNAAGVGRDNVFGRTSSSPEYKSDSTFQRWCEAWARECLRILKPGGHLLAFGGSRTWHRLAGGIEDAGFEIRDSIAWLYGSGFPKSLNLDGDWEGWGTALKPSFEPIVVARKPLAGTVAANVLAHGTGALNIDATRIEAHDDQLSSKYASVQGTGPRVNQIYGSDQRSRDGAQPHPSGRWPSNVVLDESQAAALDEQAPVGPSDAHARRSNPNDGYEGGWGAQPGRVVGFDDPRSGASRFFPVFRYEAKAPSSERPEAGGVQHPTVKPLDLMRWLVRLVASPGAVILEPFAGSGTTLEACLIEGFDVIGIERDETYLPLIVSRIRKPLQTAFDFGGVA